MTDKQLKSGLRLGHRWVGMAAAVILIVSGATGFLLQHPTWLGAPINRSFSLTADPVIAGRLLRGTHWGLELSEDGGRSWRELPMLAPPTDVVSIVFSPDDPLQVHALGVDTLVGSRDGGRVWKEIPLNIPDLGPEVAYLDLAVGSGGRLHLLTDSGLFTTGDGGESWIRQGPASDSRSTDWRGLVHDLHTGHLGGVLGRRVTEAGAVALLFITVTGVVLFRRNGRFVRR